MTDQDTDTQSGSSARRIESIALPPGSEPESTYWKPQRIRCSHQHRKRLLLNTHNINKSIIDVHDCHHIHREETEGALKLVTLSIDANCLCPKRLYLITG